MQSKCLSCGLMLVAVGCSSTAEMPERAAVTEPRIWVSPSDAVDPTALPLIDQAYVTDAPQMGAVYVCAPRQFQQPDRPSNPPWVDHASGTFDVTKKLFTQGNVWFDEAFFTVTTTDTERHFEGNGLPVNVPAGAYPVAVDDPIYPYDPNPNAIAAHTVSFSVPRYPTVAATACCAYKQIGITLDGIELHLPFDGDGSDELAYQGQDVCSGAPQPNGAYHRHVMSECLPGIHDRVALVGYALDGFGIFSPFDKDGNELTSADLDECHGTTSEIEWEGQTVEMYHYVMTRDFPYTVSCFRGRPVRNALSPLGTDAPPEMECP